MIFYKILNKNELKLLKKNYFFIGTKTDIKDGFIHLSKWTQIKGTIEKHYKFEKDIFILKIFFKSKKNVKFEKSRNNKFFPHLYENLNLSDIEEIYTYEKIKKFLN
mgnify:CR=1 FL=1